MKEEEKGTDQAGLADAVAGLVGERIVQVDSLYGGALSLHLGGLIPGRRRERGRWIITSWGADWSIEGSQSSVDSRRDTQAEILTALRLAVGAAVSQSRLAEGTLDLVLVLETGATLKVLVDPAYSGDAWTLSLPTETTISVHGATRGWSVAPDR